MKKARPIAGLFLAAAAAALGVFMLGKSAMRAPDADPARVRSAVVLGYLRDGQTFALADAYPGAWDVVEFSPSWQTLSRRAQRLLIGFNERFAQEDGPVMLLWKEGRVADAHIMPADRTGYPRFRDALGESAFRLTREDARFLCTFVHEKGGGYYLLTPEGDLA